MGVTVDSVIDSLAAKDLDELDGIVQGMDDHSLVISFMITAQFLHARTLPPVSSLVGLLKTLFIEVQLRWIPADVVRDAWAQWAELEPDEDENTGLWEDVTR